jgi:hypothetical protein
MTRKEAKVRAQAVEAVAVLTDKLTLVKESDAVWRVRAAELEMQLQNTQEELKTERALSKVAQDAEIIAEQPGAPPASRSPCALSDNAVKRSHPSLCILSAS